MADTSLPIRSLLSVIRRAAIMAIRIPPAVIGFETQSLPSRVQPKGDPACRSRAPEVQYQLSATVSGQREGLAAEPGATVPIQVWSACQGV